MDKDTNTGGVANVNATEDRNYFQNKHLNILRSEYRWVKNKEGRYFVNQYGDVFSCIRKNIIKLIPHPNGSYNKYSRVSLDGVSCSVHKLILMAWVGLPPTQKHQACHIDDNPNNNTISNLHWAERGSKYDLVTIRNDSEGAAELYLNPTNRLDADFKKAMYAQWKIIRGHHENCSCRLCSIGVEAIPLDIREDVLAGMVSVEP